MKKIRPELVLVLAAAFLAPVIGGQVSLEASPLSSGFLEGLLGGAELPLCTRALIGFLLASGLATALVKNRVVQVPRLDIGASVVLLVAIVGFSVFLSAFPYVSLIAWQNWIVFGLCLFASVSVLGRRSGVKALLWTVVIGATVTAAKGVSEFGAMRAADPGHRIFADWNNPNALAGILALALPLSLALLVSGEKAEAWAAGACGTLMMFALVLTQSKGGILAGGIGLLATLGLVVSWKGARQAMRAIGPVAVLAVLVLASARNPNAGGSGSLGRLVNAGTTQEQSVGFRGLLWKGTLQLIKERPMGFGAGTYRFESARPGLTEQTYHAHQTYLQLAMESGVAALLLFVTVIVLWARVFLVGSKTWPQPLSWMRAGVFGAVLAGVVDGLFESNLIYAGTGVTLFLLLGAGLQLSTDGSVPESTPKKLRWTVMVASCALAAIFMTHAAFVELQKAEALTAMANRDVSGARGHAEAARSVAPNDGEAWYLSASLSTDPAERLSRLKSAVDMQPSPKYLRTYARAAQSQGETAVATGSLLRALERDPNSLATLEALYKHYAALGSDGDAVKTARRLLAVEDTVYFRTRAIPELVPLETYDARLFLAERSQDAAERARLWKEAVKGYATYFERTVSFIQGLTRGSTDPNPSFLGHDRDEARAVAERARSAGDKAIEHYSRVGDSGSVAEVREALSKIRLD